MHEYLNKADWIALYGSEDLKQRWHLGDGKYSFIKEYLVERLAVEYPGFIIYGINPKIEGTENLSESWFVDDYDNLKYLSDKVRTKATPIINNEAPSLNALKIAQSYDRDVEVRLIQSINVSAAYIGDYLGWLECLYIDNWLDVFIIYKPIVAAENKAKSAKQKALIYLEDLKARPLDTIVETIAWLSVALTIFAILFLAIACVVN